MDSSEDSGDSMSDEESSDQDSNYRETKMEAAKRYRLERNKAFDDDPLKKKAYRLKRKNTPEKNIGIRRRSCLKQRKDD
jgi:hypothetical protein